MSINIPHRRGGWLFCPLPQTFLSGFLRKAYTDWEDGTRVGLPRGQGTLPLASALPKLRQQGPENSHQVKPLSIQKSALSYFLFSWLWSRISSRSILMCVAAMEGTRTREDPLEGHSDSGTRDSVGASLIPGYICLEHQLISAVSFR